MIITFDFDSTLTKEQFDEDYGVRYIGPNETMVEKLKSYFKDGNQIQVVTSRHEAFEKQYPEYDDEGKLLSVSVKDFLKNNSINKLIQNVHYTNGHLKVTTLQKIGSDLHYDDDKDGKI